MRYPPIKIKTVKELANKNTQVNLTDLFAETKKDFLVTSWNSDPRLQYEYPTFERIVKELLVNKIISFECGDCRTTHKGYCTGIELTYNKDDNNVEGFDKIGVYLPEIRTPHVFMRHYIDMLDDKKTNVTIYNQETLVYQRTKRFDL